MKTKLYSDHILIYRPNETSFLSILQRISGGILSFVFVLVFLGFSIKQNAGFTYLGYSLFNSYYTEPSFLVHLFFLIFVYLLIFHTLNGLRIYFNEEQVSSSYLFSYNQILKQQISFSRLIIHFSTIFSFALYLLYLFY